MPGRPATGPLTHAWEDESVMNRRGRARSVIAWGAFGLTVFAVAGGLTCPGADDTSTQFPLPPGNYPPRVQITSITTDFGNNFAEVGETVTINFLANCGENVGGGAVTSCGGSSDVKVCNVHVFASTSGNPTPAEKILIANANFQIVAAGPGTVVWNTAGIIPGSYNIFAEVDDCSLDPFTGTGNPPVRVASTQPVTIFPPGTLPTNGPPIIVPKLPSLDTTLSHEDLLFVRFDITDPEANVDSVVIRVFLDRDTNSSNDASDPPIELETYTLGAGFTPPNVFVEQNRQIVVDISRVPVRNDTDAQGRPLPYFVRISANDGNGNIVNAYAIGVVRILSSANGVVDLLGIGTRTAGATFQGFGGHPTIPTRGDRAGSAFGRLGDLDGDGIDDFAILAENASPFGIQLGGGPGQVYAIYGRSRAINPDIPNAPFFQGRFSGLLSLNTVGKWIDFAANDPRFRNFFRIRGQSMAHTHESTTSRPGTPSLGVTYMTVLPDVTGDERAEMLVGAPFTTDVQDLIDVDPCDQCRVTKSFSCLGPDELRTGNNALSATLSGVNGLVANVWVPGDPANAPFFGFPVNVDFGLADNQKITQISSVRVGFNGMVPNVGGMATATIRFSAQLEDECGPIAAVGPGQTEQGGTFTAEPNFTISFTQSNPGGFPVSQGQNFPPSIYDGLFTLFVQCDTTVEITSITVTIDGTVATVTDRFLLAAYQDTLPMAISDGACLALGNTGINPFYLYFLVSSAFDTFTQGPASPPINQAIDFFEPFFEESSFSFLINVYNQLVDGHRCASVENIPGFVRNSNGDVVDRDIGFYQSGIVYLAASDQLLTTIDENGVWTGDGCPEQPLGQFGQDPGECLNDSIRGARFRGAWYNPYRTGTGVGGPFAGLPYDPTSLFGYTIDAIPSLNPIFGDSDLLISAPGGGVLESLEVDLTADLGGVFPDSMSPTPTRKVVTFANSGVTFSRIYAAGLIISGATENLPRMRVSLNDTNTGLPIPGADSTILLWEGAAEQGNPEDTLRFRQFFGPRANPGVPGVCSDYQRSFFGVLMRFPLATDSGSISVGVPSVIRNIDQLLAADDISLTLELLPASTIADPSATITDVRFFISGLVPGRGYVWLLEGQDYSNTGQILADCASAMVATGPARAQSWPSTGCRGDMMDEVVRDYCFPQPMAILTGEERGDAFGWARHAGDVNADAVADFVCGAPLSSNDPFTPDVENCPCTPYLSVALYECDPFVEPAPLTQNGKAYLIYGEALLQDGPPCRYERFEVRGSHDGDQFGRAQGRAGDMTGDGYSDVYFAAENYDALGSIGNVQNRGADAGFVGVLFGNFSLTGEIAVNAEQIGTGNFNGVKFIGDSPGARIGGGLTGRSNPLFYPTSGTPDPRYAPLLPIIEYTQHGVSGAGDYNADGYDDLLISAPGQQWPAAKIEFIGPVADGTIVSVNGKQFEFELGGGVGAGRTPVIINSTAPAAAQAAFYNALVLAANDENFNVAAPISRTDFPDPMPDTPTVTFLARRPTGFAVASNSANVLATQSIRQGAVYLIFGGTYLQNKTFYLPEDLNRRVSGQLILRGIAFVSAYDKGTLDEAPIEAVSGIGDVDADGFADIIIGAPQADFINVLAPNQRRQAVGEAYLIYGNNFGLNRIP